MTIQQIEAKTQELASQVIPARYLPSFHVLPIQDQIFGISVFAASAGETEMVETCEALLIEMAQA